MSTLTHVVCSHQCLLGGQKAGFSSSKQLAFVVCRDRLTEVTYEVCITKLGNAYVFRESF